jgi:AcrR family transcriptional regulator
MSPDQRRAQLIDVAGELFVSRGYAGVSMEDICRAAGVSRPVLYEHLKTKEDAYLACVEKARATFEADLLRRVDLSAPPKEQLRAGGEAFFSYLEEDPGRWILLLGSSSILPGEKSKELTGIRFATIEKLHFFIAQSARDDVPADLVDAAAHMVSGAAERLGHWWLTRPDLSREEVVDLYVEFLWTGLGAYAKPESG